MSERVRIYVGDGLGARKLPNISFDLRRGTTLPDALREIADSIDRRKTAPDAPAERFDDGTSEEQRKLDEEDRSSKGESSMIQWMREPGLSEMFFVVWSIYSAAKDKAA